LQPLGGTIRREHRSLDAAIRDAAEMQYGTTVRGAAPPYR
jgi:hypothetical protein